MLTLFGFFVILLGKCASRVPPAACSAKPRFEDCGMKPVPVMYYYKSGSRCEVGFWRGCYPNLNMFKDEYECVSKCIFGSRAEADDYHNHMNDIYDEIPGDMDANDEQSTTPDDMTTLEGEASPVDQTTVDTMETAQPGVTNKSSEVDGNITTETSVASLSPDEAKSENATLSPDGSPTKADAGEGSTGADEAGGTTAGGEQAETTADALPAE